MPRKNIIKSYLENGFYHIYNRGVDKRTIFTDKKDSAVFLSLLKNYLSPEPKKPPTRIITINGRRLEVPYPKHKNFYRRITLLAYCLMPNHYHLLIQQQKPKDMPQFIQALGTRYTMYFNKRHQRRGTLFESHYKAVLVETDPQLLHLSRYIHLNPLKTVSKNRLALRVPPLRKGGTLVNKLLTQPSSYPVYLGQKQVSWVDPRPVIDFFSASFSKNNPYDSYQKFVEAYPGSVPDLYPDLTIDS